MRRALKKIRNTTSWERLPLLRAGGAGRCTLGMIGGLVTSTLFTLLVLPTFYWFVRGRLNARVNDPAATGVALATSHA